ncbi:c-type cytochrome biogenesis protein CcsB [Goodfellowiella coeruleoviolacea]|uniref:Cytochrome c-type biogenesis protein CcsB n=1 Tax=Goodfellowiella coeruleoviolacea TaxID=334858 RepID=A0AAE3GD02_9PSEU|nr:c-type cytochrome biogenesis protein CcsB [Goodfellowiella coeruleoviolacea]MCP2165961.1 cytochrome c-type biogenesis protein CcsB [Goodfellowiella coeruleoviolacea]
MPVDESLSTFSDWSYGSAVAVYLLAMIFLLVEQAFGRTARAAAAGRTARAAALVGAGAGGSSVVQADQTDQSDQSDQDRPRITPGVVSTPQRSRPERFGRMGAALIVLGALLHLGSIVLRGFAAGRAPWGNMYEYMSVVCFVAVGTWLALMRKFPIRRLSAFTLLPVVVLMFIGGTALYTTAAPVQPSLQSYWLVVHVSAAASGSGVLLVPGVASLLYLARKANERDPGRFVKLAARLPEADLLDRLAYRTTIIAFPVYTFGIFCGAIWAESAWGRFWGWDPKEIVAFVAWVVYAAYLHARATAGWRGNRAAWINVVGFAMTVFNLFFVNLVTTGLHSYAGV